MNSIKKYLFLIFGLITFFLAISYVGNVLQIGEKLGRVTSVYVEVAFDVLLLFAPLVFPLWKLRKNLLNYKFVCFDEILNKKILVANDRQQKAACKRIDDIVQSIRLLNKNNSELEQTLQASCYSDKICHFRNYLDVCKKEAECQGQYIAMLATLSVVVSPQRVGDTIGMLFWNFRIINKILEIYGVRPHGIALVKLYCNVLFSSLLVGSIDEIMDHIAPTDMKIPFISPLIQATSAIYASLRTVSLTLYYLEHGVKKENRKEALLLARKYALKNSITVFDNEELKKNSQTIIDGGMEYIKTKLHDFVNRCFLRPKETR